MNIRQFTVKTYMPSVPFLRQVNKIKTSKIESILNDI